MAIVSLLISYTEIGVLLKPYEHADFYVLGLILWGFTVSFVALQFSRVVAKLSFGIELLEAGGVGGWIVEESKLIALKAGVKIPQIGVYESTEIMAFTTGANSRRSLIAISTGMLNSLDRESIRAVLAHEIGHIANEDVLIMALLQGFINSMILVGSRFILSMSTSHPHFYSFFPYELGIGVLGIILTCWFSRKREFEADRAGAALVGADRLIRALRAIVIYTGAGGATIGLGRQASMSGRLNLESRFWTLFSYHPSFQERIARLNQGCPR